MKPTDSSVPPPARTPPQDHTRLDGGCALSLQSRSFTLDLAAIRGIRRWLEARAQEARLSTAQQGHATMVASELLVNLLEHAQPPPSSVELSCKIERGRLTTEIRASTHSFDDEAGFHAAISEPEDVDAMAEGGMGLYLIAQFTSELRYRPAKGRDQPEVFTFTIEAR